MLALKRIRARLFTHEDSSNLHKLLGFTCLSHYIYRLYCVWVYNTSGLNTTNPNFIVWATPFLHTFLSLSSFIFRIPNQRPAGTRPIIYRELQLHNIIFTSRSFSIYLLALLTRHFDQTSLGLYITRFFLIMTWHYLSDVVTKYYYRPKNSTTIRGMPWPKWIPKVFHGMVTKFYGISQFIATASLIFAVEHALDVSFFFAFAIQLSTFLMTLVKKDIVSAFAWHFWYSAALLSNFFIHFGPEEKTDYNENANIVFAVLAVSLISIYTIRVKFHTNKYILWLCFTTSAYYMLEIVLKSS